MLHTIANLEILGLTTTEARVYIAVLQNPNVNGSQLTKQLDVPKPSIYLALDKLYTKGLVNLIPSKTKQYIAQDINIAFERLRNNLNSSLDTVLKDLQQLQPKADNLEFIHIDGYQNFVQHLKSMIQNCQRELYLHVNYDLHDFYNELTAAANRGVRIIIYGFGQQFQPKCACEFFFDTAKPAHSHGIRILAVSDYKSSLSVTGTQDKLLSIYTENQLQVSLIAENIHNAIYWLKLYQLNPNFDYPCRLETLAEQDIHISGYSI